MQTIGATGGMSRESSSGYYRLLNRYANARLGGHRNARSLMVTVGFGAIVIPGCTGTGLSSRRHDSALPGFDTTARRAQAAVERALRGA